MPKRVVEKLYRQLSDPQKAAWWILALAVALCFTFGGLILQYTTNNDLKGKVNNLQQGVEQEREAKKAADAAALKLCRQTLKDRTKQFELFLHGYQQDAETAYLAYVATPKDSEFRNIRYRSWQTKKEIAIALEGYLPLRCQPPKREKQDVLSETSSAQR